MRKVAGVSKVPEVTLFIADRAHVEEAPGRLTRVVTVMEMDIVLLCGETQNQICAKHIIPGMYIRMCVWTNVLYNHTYNVLEGCEKFPSLTHIHSCICYTVYIHR